MDRLRQRLSYANVIASLALFIALGGASYAAITLPRNSVGARELKRGAVKKAKLAANAVTGSSVRDGSLAAADFGEALPAGPTGPKGDAGTIGVHPLAGSIGAITKGPYRFAGPTTTISLAAGQAITGAASLPLAVASGSPVAAEIGLCYSTNGQPPLTNFSGASAQVVRVATLRVAQAVAATAAPAPGSYTVGACVMAEDDLTDNGSVNGWVMVTN